MKTYHGRCHCKAITYEASLELESAIECNCSHCARKGLLLVFVPRDQFVLHSGEALLTEYRFNTKQIKHLFCSRCGVESFAYGKDAEGNDIVSVNVRSLEEIDMELLTRIPYNGKDQ